MPNFARLSCSTLNKHTSKTRLGVAIQIGFVCSVFIYSFSGFNIRVGNVI